MKPNFLKNRQGWLGFQIVEEFLCRFGVLGLFYYSDRIGDVRPLLGRHLEHDFEAAAQYASLLKELGNATKKTKRSARAQEVSLRKLRRWFDEIREADYFEADHGHDADAAIAQWAQSLSGESVKALPVLTPDDFQKRTWVTRPRPEIDRCASAWFIRRFVDRSAKFLFANKRIERPKIIAFDMAGRGLHP